MKKIYISPELELFYDVAEPTLSGTSAHDIETDPTSINGGNALPDDIGMNFNPDTNPNNPESGWDPGDIIDDGDLE